MADGENSATGRARTFRDWHRFIVQDGSVLKEHPSLVFQQAANQPEGTAPARAAAAFLAAGGAGRPWLRRVNKAADTGALVMSITGHGELVVACAFSRDERTLATASYDGEIRFWDVETGREARRLATGRYDLMDCSFSSTFDRLAAHYKRDKLVELRDPVSGSLVASFPGHLVSRFSPDDKLIATALRMDLQVWRADTGEPVCALSGHAGRVMSCAFSPDGRRLVSASDDNTLKIWDMTTGRELGTLAGHGWTVRSCAFSPDGSRVVSVADDETIGLWDAGNGVLVRSFKGYAKYLKACLFARGGAALVAPTGDTEISVWDAAGGQKLFELSGPQEPIKALAVSPNGTMIAAGSDDKTLWIWSAESGEEIAVHIGHDSFIQDCAFSPSGRLAVSTSMDRTAKVWRTDKAAAGGAGGRHRQFVKSCRFVPGGGLVLTASADHALKAWDGETGACRATLAGHQDGVNACAIAETGLMAVSIAQSGKPMTWDLHGFKKMAAFSRHEMGGAKCAFSPDGLRVATVDFDSRLWLWDPFTGAAAGTSGFKTRGTDMRDFAFSPDGSSLVVSLKESVDLVSARSGRTISSRRVMDYPKTGVVPDVRCFVSPRGDRVAVLDLEKDLRHVVYALPDWREVALRDVPAAAFSSLRNSFEPGAMFSPDGRALAVPGTGTLFVWDAGSGERIAALDYPAGTFWSNTNVRRHFAFSDDAARLAVQGVDGALLWDVAAGRAVGALGVAVADVHGFYFSPDGAWLAAAVGTGLRLWDAETGAAAGSFPSGSRISDLGWSPDGRRFAYGTANGDFGLVALENLRAGEPLAFAWEGSAEKKGLFRRAAAPSSPGLRVRCPVCLGWSDLPAEAPGTVRSCGACGRRLRISPKKLAGDWRRPRS